MQPCTIGEMRDRVSFSNVSDVINPTTKRSEKVFAYESPEYACIRPVGTQLFFEGYDTESAVTHTVYTRWRADAETYQYIVHRILLPDAGEAQELIYEIVRSTDWNGFRVYTRCDVRLDSRK